MATIKNVRRGISALRMTIEIKEGWVFKRIYSPDKKRMLQALNIVLSSNWK